MEIPVYGNSDNQLKYNGKELQTEAGLEWYDYGARFYDPVLGRWHSVDPMAEKYRRWSPYNYCLDNPLRYIDIDGKDIYRYDNKSGNFVLFKKTNDKIDQVGKFKYDKETNTYSLKTNKKGEAKVSINNIEKGILKDGFNFKITDQVIGIGGQGQASLKGVENFVMSISNYIDKEISGYYLSKKGESNLSFVYLSKYANNTDQMANSSFRIDRTRPELINKIDVNTAFHTHLSRFDDLYRLTPSDLDIETKNYELQSGVQNFIIVTTPENVPY